MANGALGESGDCVLLPVVRECVPKNELVIILPKQMEEKAVTLMDLLMKSPEVVTAELVVVYETLIIYTCWGARCYNKI